MGRQPCAVVLRALAGFEERSRFGAPFFVGDPRDMSDNRSVLGPCVDSEASGFRLREEEELQCKQVELSCLQTKLVDAELQ